MFALPFFTEQRTHFWFGSKNEYTTQSFANFHLCLFSLPSVFIEPVESIKKIFTRTSFAQKYLNKKVTKSHVNTLFDVFFFFWKLQIRFLFFSNTQQVVKNLHMKHIHGLLCAYPGYFRYNS